MSQSEYTTITVREEDKRVFKQTLDLVATELGDEPTHSDALRELSEAYVGRNPRGRWREE